MKALTLVLLVLALGAGLLYFVLDSDGDRGTRTERGSSSPTSSPEEPAPPKEAPRSEPAQPARPKLEAGPQRQSVSAGVVPEARLILEGTVIAEGAPVPGASLTLLRHDVLLAESQTDGHGRFKLESEPLGSAGVLRVVARGLVATERNLAARPAGGTLMLGNLRLLRGQRLTGRVVDGRNQGVPDCELRAEPVNAGGDLLVARGRSGPDGSFEIGDAPPGTLVVSARARGFGEESVQYTAGGGQLTIQLQPGVELRFLLRTPRGQPVAGAEVTLQAPNDPRTAKRVAESDADGRVVFEGLGDATWSVRVTHPEYRPSGRSQVQATGKEEPIECVPWPAIEGLVRAPGGAVPPPGTRVLALPAAAPSEIVGNLEGGQEVRPDGSFHLGGLRAGDWRVRVVAPGFAPATSMPVKLGIEGDGHAGTIQLEAGARLEFVITLEGRPMAGAELELQNAPPTPAQLWAHTARGPAPGRRFQSGGDGHATLENLSPGTVWIAIFAAGCPPSSSGPHVVGSGSTQPIAVELTRGGRVVGKVTRKSGNPASRAQLRIVERGGLLGFPITVAAEMDGTYGTAWLPAGHYSIEAFAPEEPTLRSGQREVDVQAGEQRTLDLEL